MTAKRNTENLQQYKGKISLIVERIQAFTSSTNFVLEVENFSPNFKIIA